MSDEPSPAEQYAAFRNRKAYPNLAQFTGDYPFAIDPFQVAACEQVEEGHGVLVAAPTGSGKTLVGEFAIYLAMQLGRKCFYTTPIKALSNQKYHDLVARYGADNVGLLTGDHSVNGEAPIVVMTTEVLRNMLYAGSQTLRTLGYVVLDEVHYLADRMRGAVWEEVIIHLPESVSLIALSATVSNAEEFGDWLREVRGDVTTIVEEQRPVPLFQHVMVGRRLNDLFADHEVEAQAGFVGEGAEVNPELMKLARDEWARSRIKDRRAPRGKGSNRQRGGRGSGPNLTPRRTDVVQRLERERLLPAIYFIFSRAGCDAAVTHCVEGNLQLTTAEERKEIVLRAREHSRDLPEQDLHVLGFHNFLDSLSRGVAAHHAGMLPRFKELVEELYQRGLLKIVFATETLALGINMPARTVVLERLSKWNGEAHVDLSPGEYTQLTGRAGRRGLDVEGHAVVLWQRGLNPREVAGLASTRTYPLLSSFRPSYNMAVNLVHALGRTRARTVLEQSFAQYQADRSVVGLARKLRKSEEALSGYADAATCDKGDFMEYARLRDQVNQAEKESARQRRAAGMAEVTDSVQDLARGDVFHVPSGKFTGFAVMIEPGAGAEPRPFVLTRDGHARRLGQRDLTAPVEPLAKVAVPKGFDPRNVQHRKQVASGLSDKASSLPRPDKRRKRHADPQHDDVTALRHELRKHPCHQCPDREDHARWAERWFKLDRDSETLRQRIEGRTNSVARAFDKVCDVLSELTYLDDDSVTEAGSVLMRLFGDMDIVAAEALRRGLWDGLKPSELGAVLSILVFESRRPEDAPAPKLPWGTAEEAIHQTVRLWFELDKLEQRHGLSQLKEPDLGFAWAAYRWAEGDELDTVLRASRLAAGDFVRWVKQLLDLADQVAQASPTAGVRKSARALSGQLRRGVVSYSAEVESE